jgi:hypothetical protein
MNDKTTNTYLREIEGRLNEVPINLSYLEGFAAGVHVANCLSTATGHTLSDACDIYRMYHEVVQRRLKG